MIFVFAIMVMVCMFVLAAMVIMSNDSSLGSSGGTNYAPGSVSGLVPTKFSLFGKTHYYQAPPNARGSFVMLPGCARSATGFWPYSAQAPECNAFPEDVSHTKQALLSGYAILVPTPQNSNLCFSGSSGDFEKVGPIIQKFLELTNLRGKPLFLAGSSAGGGVAVRFPEYAQRNNVDIRIDGLLLECATNQSPLNGDRPSVPNFPPTVWVCMERDTESQREANSYAQALQRAGIGAAVVVSPKRRISHDYFSNRMVNVSPADSKKVADGLRSIGMVDAEGWLTTNPHDNLAGWMNRLKRFLPNTREFTLGSVRKSPLYQALAVAYAGHEHIADYTTSAFKFFEARGKANMADLVTRHQVSVPSSLKV